MHVEEGKKRPIDGLTALEVDEHAVDGAETAAALDVLYPGQEAFERPAFDRRPAKGGKEHVPLRDVVGVIE